MLPVSTTQRRSAPTGIFSLYFKRLLKPKQMDFQYTFWTMLQLLISPKTVYRQASYHKQTKNHWARDDPAFVIASAGVVAALSLVYGSIFAVSFIRAFSIVISSVLVEYLAVGCAMATSSWLVANKLLQRRSPHPHSAAGDQAQVEWAFSWDVHCNAVFPLVLLLGVSQLVLSPVLLIDSRFAAALSALLYTASLAHYWYIVFLGYSALPFLDRPETFLYPCFGLVVALLLSLLVGFNPTKPKSRIANLRRIKSLRTAY